MNAVHEQIWQDFLKIIREDVGSRVIDTWIKAVHLSHYDPITHEVCVLAPNSFVKNWVETHYKNLFIKHLKRLFGIEQIQVNFLIEHVHKGLVVDTEHVSSKIVPAIQEPNKKKRNELVRKVMHSRNVSTMRLNAAYTFQNFVVGSTNQFAYASAQAVADKLGGLYNPLLIYGPAGLGKTHLLHAIGNHALEKNNNLMVLYQTADRFVSEFIQAIRTDSVVKFQNQFKNIDLFLIDDIQFLINKEQTQEIFFHVFNSLYENNKQIVLSCDTLPRYLGGLADRLKSRLEWGLVADVQIPDLETKLIIIRNKSKAQGVIINDDVALLLAQQKISSVRELEGLLIRVLAYVSLTQQELTLSFVEKFIGLHDHAVSKKHIVDVSDIISAVKKHYGFDLTMLRSKDRSKSVSNVRHVAMYLMKNYSTKSLREIGDFFDRKDHTTVTHGITRVHKMMQVNEQFALIIKNIQDELS